MRRFVSFLICFSFFLISKNIQAQADWVKLGPDGKLVYKKDDRGNRVMDFSTAGYMKGEVPIPNVAVKVTVNADSGDMTTTIQNAINKVAAMPLVKGFRGAVLLGPGTFNISSPIKIDSSGVVLRGSGSGDGGTTIYTTITTAAIVIAGSGSYITSDEVNVEGNYIPSGATSFKVKDASHFKVGNNVVVYRTATAAWIHYLGMDQLVRRDKPQTWISAGTRFITDRTIKSISGNTITLDAPLTDSYDSVYLGYPVATMVNYTFPGRISQVGVENLRVLFPAGKTNYKSFNVSNVINGWLSNVVSQETQDSYYISKSVKQFTLYKCISKNTTPIHVGAPKSNFNLSGTQILLDNCKSIGTGMWGVVTAAQGTGPIVILNYSSDDRGVTPHMRWTTGTLVDGGDMSKVGDNGGNIRWENRNTMGSGHGWTSAWCVAWNVKTFKFICDAAPGTYNWFIGGTGSRLSKYTPGIVDSVGTDVQPASLYLQQLKERLNR